MAILNPSPARVRQTAWLLALLSVTGFAGCMQVPTVPSAGAAPTTCNLWSFLCPTDQQKQSMKNCFCACPLGQMFNSMLKPMSAMSGGLVPGGICPGPDQPNPADLAKSADSAEGAAARIKQSEADAKARRAAVRYLGTVDCRRFPEAEAAIVNSLLTDPNECVRLEAAMALSRACCCTKKTMQALIHTVSGQGGNDPPETSERVRYAAAMALERCVERGCAGCDQEPRRPESPAPPEKPLPAETPPAAAAPPPPPAAAGQPRTDPLVQQAQRVLELYWASRQAPADGPPSSSGGVPTMVAGAESPEQGAVEPQRVELARRPAPPSPQTPLATGQRGLLNLIRSSFEPQY